VCLLLSLCVLIGCPKNQRTSRRKAADNSSLPSNSSQPGNSTTPGSAPSKNIWAGLGEDQPSDPTPVQVTGLRIVPLDIQLPAPAFKGTPVPTKEPNVAKPRGKPRDPFLAPEGTVNLARDMPVACSDPAPPAGEVDFVTDGDKEASDFGYLELRPGTEWVQIDLGQQAAVYAVLVWHNHAEVRVYRDVIVQIGDDPDFLDPKTVFNNDYDGSSGMGIGQDKGYVETSEGRLIDCRGAKGRYVRLYSRGNHVDAKNHYTEVEVFGRPL